MTTHPAHTAPARPALPVTTVTIPTTVLHHLRTLPDAPAALTTAEQRDTWDSTLTADVPALDWMSLHLDNLTQALIEDHITPDDLGFTLYSIDAARMEAHAARVELITADPTAHDPGTTPMPITDLQPGMQVREYRRNGSHDTYTVTHTAHDEHGSTTAITPTGRPGPLHTFHTAPGRPWAVETPHSPANPAPATTPGPQHP
ncbi:hypothetical protein [Wenjunlia tyrosinilytica]|uniref:Uncharacterized protein n=1 Tax=Wenjunlia tyrosinilytica TaxID=1544741 RepID=A0A918E249_9ACTN|nr:hypothetical protein [Wenjunlia tyrosinilytica]GGO98213.1 hypothetical protein GCM10012280_61820 [Wenjunlia tyrosinilytica]